MTAPQIPRRCTPRRWSAAATAPRRSTGPRSPPAPGATCAASQVWRPKRHAPRSMVNHPREVGDQHERLLGAAAPPLDLLGQFPVLAVNQPGPEHRPLQPAPPDDVLPPPPCSADTPPSRRSSHPSADMCTNRLSPACLAASTIAAVASMCIRWNVCPCPAARMIPIRWMTAPAPLQSSAGLLPSFTSPNTAVNATIGRPAPAAPFSRSRQSAPNVVPACQQRLHHSPPDKAGGPGDSNSFQVSHVWSPQEPRRLAPVPPADRSRQSSPRLRYPALCRHVAHLHKPVLRVRHWPARSPRRCRRIPARDRDRPHRPNRLGQVHGPGALLLGTPKPRTGDATIDGVPVASLSGRERSRRLAYIPQRPEVWAPFTVEEVVRFGRFGSGGGSDVVARAMSQMMIADRSDEVFGALSEGQRQRVSIARVLAQFAEPVDLAPPAQPSRPSPAPFLQTNRSPPWTPVTPCSRSRPSAPSPIRAPRSSSSCTT